MCALGYFPTQLEITNMTNEAAGFFGFWVLGLGGAGGDHDGRICKSDARQMCLYLKVKYSKFAETGEYVERWLLEQWGFLPSLLSCKETPSMAG